MIYPAHPPPPPGSATVRYARNYENGMITNLSDKLHVVFSIFAHFPPSEMCEKSLGSTSPQPSVAPTTPSPERATGLRLNRTLTPSHYNVEVRPHLNEDEFGFDGSVGIWMTAQAPTDVITLHVDELTIHGPTVVLR